jgi:alkylation response protein AidB-like acyl-CoA dehydrogenase
MTYQPPTRDLMLALQASGHASLLDQAFPQLDNATVEAVLEAAGALSRDVLAPLNRKGDLEGARMDLDGVKATPGFAAAHQALACGGWLGLAADPEHGGQGLSKALELAAFETFDAANMALALCSVLTLGAAEALAQHGTPRQKRLILPRLVSGQWTGTMNLTEPQAGSDLAAVNTRATPDGQGGYRLTGQKIFISWGDHDIAENICHLVLARLPDAPAGVRGISLFLATKYLVDENGAPGPANQLRAVSLEHKLGIHGSPTCVMAFEDAQAELVGEVNQGLAQMFVMMNAARLHVGLLGVAIAERALQQALAYAQDRRQGRAPWAPQDAIFGHPDIRAGLVLAKAKIEAARGICLSTAVYADLGRLASDPTERAVARALSELLTPIAKAWSTDIGVEVASQGLQVHGGMGFIEETGAAQHYRDARILPIYEGTNGIQAIDLIGRKVSGDDGEAMAELCGRMRDIASRAKAAARLASSAESLEAAVDALEQASAWIRINKGPAALAAASAFMRLAGDVVGGWVLLRNALLLDQMQDARLPTKALLAEIYSHRVLALAPGRARGLMQDLPEMASLSAEALGG